VLTVTVRVLLRNLGQPLGSRQTVLGAGKFRLFGKRDAVTCDGSDSPRLDTPAPLRVTGPANMSKTSTVTVKLVPETPGTTGLAAGIGVANKAKSGT